MWRVRASLIKVRVKYRRYTYAEIRIRLPAEYAGKEFIIIPIEDYQQYQEPHHEKASVESYHEPQKQEANEPQANEPQKPEWVSNTVEEMFPPLVKDNPWVEIIRRRR